MILAVVVGKSWAGTSDTTTVSVTPNVTYAVQITSPVAGGYDFQTVNLGATTVSTLAIDVRNAGNVAEYFGLAISNTSGSWAPGVTPDTDTFRMIGYFNATEPSTSTFVTGDALTTSVGSGQNKFGQGTNKTLANTHANLWLRLDMPTALNVGTTATQTMTLTVNGQSS